jgi:ABC-type multidrug transport system fused ATPase/permease subunit
VMQALERLMKGRTVITIAHRLSTVRDADWIIVLSAGVVAEEGTHDDLMKRGGVYAALYQLQSKGNAAGGSNDTVGALPALSR